ncbi:Fic family protein [Arthrobacter sp. Y-9]|uniref:Fic/DOC family protein n=1 Tax=Arthrobacter sp. Y-9 TaxID=3039385 RepID=UPI00241DC6D3|nr:Fic family protein [Arthrobacter sp. Y-9]WFR83262.1 Fic family protein [Arthrobacter sp. Y-9]
MDTLPGPEAVAQEEYIYPETCDPATGRAVFQNLHGIRDLATLATVESELATARFRQLLQGVVRIPLEPDTSYLQDVHRHLFQDTYAWAGELRTVNLAAGDIVFPDRNLLRTHLRPVLCTAATTDWRRIDLDGFVRMASILFAGLNHVRPFRTGNGRMIMAVLHEISTLSRFEFDFDRVSRYAWDAMTQATLPARGEFMPRATEAVAVFRAASVGRTTPVPNRTIQAMREISRRSPSGRFTSPDALRARHDEAEHRRYHGYGEERQDP